MEIKTFDTILTGLCDTFDELITPKTISRSNTNVVYLILKAVAKGYEIINNICVVLSNKFDPAKCTVEDLNSVASLVGTEKYKGSASGLHILATNTADSTVTILAGLYTYKLNDEVTFEFEVLEDTDITAGNYVTFIAMSDSIGKYEVTAQSNITVESNVAIDSSISFSCTDNTNLLGTEDETNLEFRKRILNSYDGQDTIVELETQLKNLPYLFDSKVLFNNESVAQTIDGITIPPFEAIIFYSGSPRSEIANVIANKIICPTVQTADSVAIEYESNVFVNGKHTFYLTPFGTTDFEIEVLFKINEQYADENTAKETMSTALIQYFMPEVHKDYIREDDVYNVLESLNLVGVTILGVNLKVSGSVVDYVSVPVSRIPKLIAPVQFTKEGN